MALTLKQRAYAGLWFMTAGAIPVLVVGSVVSSGVAPLHTFDVVIWFLVVPLLVTGLIGSLLGARILDASRVRSGWRAAFRGLIVAVAAFLSSVILISILLTVTDSSSPFDKDELFVRTLFMTLMVGTLVVGWLVVIVGVLAGWLLYQLQASKEKRSGMS